MKSTDSIDISIIIITYNNEHEIGTCLTSIKKAVPRFATQIILIDNNSKDQTFTIATQAIKKFNQHHLLKNNENLGFTSAINQGLRIADGKFILLLNPDTIIPENTFDILIPIFEQDRQIGIVAPQFLNANGSIQPSCRRFPRHRDVLFHLFGLNLLFPSSRIFNGWKMGDFDHQSERLVDQPQGAFLLAQRRAVDDVGLLDENFPMFFSDVDWCHRFKNKGWKILFTPKVKIIHHKGKSVYQNRIPLIWSSHVSFYRYFQKYFRTGFGPAINLITGALLLKLALIRIFCLKFRQLK